MNINDYAKLAASCVQANRLDDLLVQQETQSVTVASPLMPHRKVSWLSGAKPIEDYRAEVHQNSRRIAEQHAASCACVAGFVQALREAYGDAVAETCVSGAGLKESKPLTARAVSTAIAQARRLHETAAVDEVPALPPAYEKS